MMALDKRQIARQFSRAAHSYPEVSEVQAKMAARIFALPALENFLPNRILDLGCGSGQLVAQLSRRFSGSQTMGLDIASGMLDSAGKYLKQGNYSVDLIQGDIESLPIATGSIDLVVSNAALQWTNFGTALVEIERILSPGGRAILATFVEGTLAEWHRASCGVGLNRVHQLPSEDHLLKIAGECGLHLLSFGTFEDQLAHATFADLLSSTKRMGATNAEQGRFRGLMGRHRYRALTEALANEFPDQRYQSTYRSCLLMLEKAR